MESVSVLRRQLFEIPEEYRSVVAFSKTEIILLEMESRQLEATDIGSSKAFISLFWRGELNPNRSAFIYCTKIGLVVGMTVDGGIPGSLKIWNVLNLSSVSRPALDVPLDESLEYIRHFLWADHSDV